MSTKNNLLVELLCEELPPKWLRQLGDTFAEGIYVGLKKRLYLADTWSTMYATPRRIAVHIGNVLAVSRDVELNEKLMPASVAFDAANRATPALKKRLEKIGRGHLADAWPDAVDGPDRLYLANDGKAEGVYLHTVAPGRPLNIGLFEALEEALWGLPIPKVMTYQLSDGWTSVDFVRPAHRLIALHGNDVVPIRALGLDAGRVTSGHRFQGQETIELHNADDYEMTLKNAGNVIASFENRRAEIDRQLRAHAQTLKFALETGAAYDALLDEVTALVEYPTVYVGTFEPEFLEVPQECLTLTMRANQKYFPLFDANGKLTNKFLIVSNMRLDDPRNIVAGNERVIRPRLSDARFFFDQDRKQTLDAYLPKLANVVYHHKLGSQGERGHRVLAIAGDIARLIGAPVEQAQRAAQLAKADLVTDMVGEFPELQGIMGRYYALHDQEPLEVANAIEDHYKPRFAGDTLPRGLVGCAVALADKLETLAGLFGIGQVPTGDKDPFALRRAALGVIRILVERDLTVKLNPLVGSAFAAFHGKVASAHTDLESFIYQRMEGFLRDKSYTAIEIDAVLSMRPGQLNLVPRQLAAVRAFMQLPEAESLAAANKRVANILKKNEQTDGIRANADETKLVETAERSLFDALKRTAPAANALLRAHDFTGYLKSFAVLKAPVDAFFDNVMVMSDDASLRNNRLALLHDLRTAMNQVADISRLAAQ
ncbi:MAG: glycine--tRNA ligase subunit beta [Burkholderiales bacterium]